MNINVYDLAQLSDEAFAALLQRAQVDIADVVERVRPIVEDVAARGDAALLEYTAKYDRVTLEPDAIKVSEAEFDRARANLDPELKEIIEVSAANIRTFHEAQLPEAMWFTQIDDGIMAGEKITPITSVGLYVPRGKGSFPSVMLMLGIPAMVARVPRVIVCTPPTPEGSVDDASLYAAEICGIKDVYKVGGSQAIAAMGYGTESVPQVHKAIGPGNPYVAAAKRLLYGKLDVGTPAGPSESIILCDAGTDPRIAALDLLIEAEHGPDSCALLVTESRELANAVTALLPDLIAALPEKRREFCSTVLSNYGGIVLTSSVAESVQFVNDFAPEHLEVLLAEPLAWLPKINNAGEILLGPHTPITMGNFSLGVNAILPTGGAARTFSCVTVYDFLKRSSIGYMTEEGYAKLRDVVVKFAEYEGFAAHANAVRNRGVASDD